MELDFIVDKQTKKVSKNFEELLAKLLRAKKTKQ
jgi:hypothetical protein